MSNTLEQSAGVHALNRRAWSPLVEGENAQPLLSSVQEIAAVLKRRLSADLPGSAELMPYLGQGAAGFAVFFAYAGASGILRDAREAALQYLEFGIDSMGNRAMGPSLYGGFTGIAWAVEHLTALLGEASGDLSAEVDNAMEAYLSKSPWLHDYDLINGLVGFGVYGLERRKSTSARVAMEMIVERLDELAEHSADGICWFTGPALLVEEQRASAPEGYYNLGLAHGIPGIIALLAKAIGAGIAQEKATRLLEQSIFWLLKQKLPAGKQSSFPNFILRNRAPGDCRLAWCYGDAGLAAALLLAARTVGVRRWEDEALAVLRRAAARPPDTSGVKDACFCHGSAGLAHIFNRVFQATQDEVFAEAARYWIRRTLDYRQPGQGVAGYLLLAPTPGGGVKLHGTLNVLEGIAGIGLTLLAATTGLAPDWDRMFLVDIPLSTAAES